MLRHDLDGIVQVAGFEDEYATQLFFSLSEWSISDGYSAVLEPQRGGISCALERFAAQKVTMLSKLIVVSEALIHESVSLAFGHRVPFLLVHVSKAYVFHAVLLSVAADFMSAAVLYRIAFFQLVYRRTFERVIFPVLHKPLSHGVVQDIQDLCFDFFILAKNMIIEVFLPMHR